MPSRTVAISLALLLVLAGCLGAPGVDSPAPSAGSEEPTHSAPATATERESRSAAPTDAAPTESATPTATPSPTATPVSTPASTATSTLAADSDATNPWGTAPVVVAVRDADGRDRAALVREATDYWEANAERYTGFDAAYEVRPNATRPDIVVEFVDEVPSCGGADDAAGCAPLVRSEYGIDRPETVFIRTGFSEESTVRVLKHEFGHTLGLTHDDAPADLMAGHSVLYTEPRPNATERAFPWDDASFSVYVDAANASDPDGAREQVEHALDYYERGAAGMPHNLSFAFVDDRESADVVVTFSEESPCASGAASCGATRGLDPDGDGAVETYANLRVTLVDLDTEAVGWHVGYWMAFVLGAEDDADKPAPFRDADYDDRRSEWWR